jgi:hypothetical protein
MLKLAQALGDIQTLQAHGRRVVRLHFSNAATAAAELRRIFSEAMS